MPNDGIRLKIILIIEVRKLEFTDFDSHSQYSYQNFMLHDLQQAKKNTDIYLNNHLEK